MNPLQRLTSYGQSVWLDYVRRNLLTTGELANRLVQDGVTGVTSNPAIFEKAISGSNDYAGALAELSTRRELDAKAAYEDLALDDVRHCADVLASVWADTGGRDGYVSLEVAPALAHDTRGTVEEARRLWARIGRPNAMIKVPATAAGLPAIEELTREGIPINVTLLFSQKSYEQVAKAYLRGLERRADAGGDVSRVASVASFFVSRIDSAVDERVQERLEQDPAGEERALLRSVLGRVAVANAKLAYQRYRQIFSGERWKRLADLGAQTQRLLWASTSVKNPAYRDVLYVEELIGPDTVNTMPPSTMDAFRDHGRPRPSLEDEVEAAQDLMETLDRLEICLDEVTDRLLEDGLRLFAEAFDRLLAAVERARRAPRGTAASPADLLIPPKLGPSVQRVLREWQEQDKVARLWARDASLWTNSDEASWLDWLAVAFDQRAHLADLRRIARAVEGDYFRDLVLLGMGGSSLAPEVLRETFGQLAGYPNLHVLDSTDPAQIRSVEAAVDLTHTAFIVSSKSGTTLEPNVLKQYFFARASEALGSRMAGRHFVAITDPGSKLEHVARGDGFRQVFYGRPGIGGRYSALSNFGMTPAAAMGIDVTRFVDGAVQMAEACAACVPPVDNPGVILGAILGSAAASGRDKLTIVASPAIASLGAWLEQLIAESTGKEGKGIIPVDGERLGPPEVYGDDRLFVYLRLDSMPDATQDAAVDRLEAAGQPIVRIPVPDVYDLGQEFFRWEIATAVAGAVLGINPFNQPDVEASKIETRRLTAEYEASGSFPTEPALFGDGEIRLYADERNAIELRRAAGSELSLVSYLRGHLGRLRPGDYFALLAFVARNEAHETRLQAIRHRVRDQRKVATCLGFGPRFLHSTGQAYKGGPDTGVFLQITCDDAVDLPVPGQRYTFGVVKAAQARGDLQVLSDRGRRVLRAHLGADSASGLERLLEAFNTALGS